ncbi:MAG TPA: hypothetical protein VGC99_19250 [Candidatus Tectomicrobia bacterium]
MSPRHRQSGSLSCRIPSRTVALDGPARHEEATEKAAYPLHRIMDIETRTDGILITTTDIHLPRRIGEALHHAYRGELEVHSVDEDRSLRVHWQRE